MSDASSPTASISHKWREIADLPEDIETLRDRELESLYQVWIEQKKGIVDDKRITDFNAHLAREWAIETGIIEGVYTLDRGITQTLIERGIDSAYIPHDATNRDPELVARIIQAHAEVLEGLFAFVTGERAVSIGYVKELHSALLRYQDSFVVFNQFGQKFEKALEKGSYKTLPNNPRRADGTVHEYCPPEHVASEMDRLIELHQQHAKRGIHCHTQAAWLHHAFTQIHPFQDGNGRVARALASLVFIKSDFFPLVVNRNDRERYIDALEAADRGDLLPLGQLFAQIQKRALTRAIGMAVDVKPVSSVEEALVATRDMLIGLGRIIPANYLIAKDYATNLMGHTMNRFNGIVQTLHNEIARVNSSFQFSAGNLAAAPLAELKSIAGKLQYDPNTNDFHQSAVLTLSAAGVASRIVITFQGVGAAFRGLLAVTAYFQVGDGLATPLCEDIFRISYEEARPDVEQRFAKWLDPCLMNGLAEWRRTLV
jgi:fido (protein-threonine AMPylation protein)